MNRSFKYLFFDLDGTLTTLFDGITNSIIYALEKFGIGVEDRGALTSFIGPPPGADEIINTPRQLANL